MISIPLEPLRPDLRLPATEERIQELEKLSGLSLPPSYRDFLQEHGGSGTGNEDGYVIAPYVGANGKESFAAVDTIYGFYSKPADAYDLRSAFATYRGRVPKGSLPIAQTPGGNQVCVVADGDSAGSVLVWDHERGVHHRLAPTFPEFLRGLRLKPYPDVG